jgi:hypothetical protein
MVVSNVESAVPPLTRFPSVTYRRLILPKMGERISVYCKFSFAKLRFASATPTAASAATTADLAESIRAVATTCSDSASANSASRTSNS